MSLLPPSTELSPSPGTLAPPGQLPPPRVVPPPGWYPDPWGGGGQRWWAGAGWTHHVVEPVEPPEPPRTFPVRAGVIGIMILFVSLLASQAIPSIARTLGVGALGYLALAVLFGYGPSLAWCVHVARAHGAGSVRSSLGLRMKAVDVGWGPLTWAVILAGQVALAAVIRATHIPSRSNLDRVGSWHPDKGVFLAIAFTAVIVAPLAEEILFRGVVLPAFTSRVRFPIACLAQGVIFGMAHYQVDFGWQNLGLVVILAWAGTALGYCAGKLGRLAPSIIAHGCINGLAMLILYGTTFLNWHLVR